jgi:hypothetical protein
VDTKLGSSPAGTCGAIVSGSKEKLMNQNIVYF